MALTQRSASDSDSEEDDGFTSLSLNFLPNKLLNHLMPFQRNGILFGIDKHGRFYNVVSGKYHTNTTVNFNLSHFSNTRGNIVIEKAFKKNRIDQVWNSLLNTVVSAESTDTFKNLLDLFLFNQHKIFDWNANTALTMGLGKTIQALSVAYFYREEWPLLIIVPSSLRYPWIEELEKWFPDILPDQINSVESSSDITSISTASITFVSYGLLRHPSSKMVQEALMNQSFKVVIVDESHYIKNRKAATTKFLVPLLQQARRKILLTGTPALNRPEELFPQLTSIDPKLFGNWSQYTKRYCDARFQYFGRQRRWVTDGASNLEELQMLLTKSLMIRRLKQDVLTQLPAKQRQKIAFSLKESDVKRELNKTLDAINKLMSSNQQTASQMFCSSELITATQPKTDSSPRLNELYGLLSDLHMKTCSAKLGPVMSYVQMLCENQDLKFIVFAYHRIMLDRVCEKLVEDKVTFIRIDGSTLSSDRPYLVKQFQTDQNTRVAVLSIKAAGVGLTLTAASLVVFAELDWTPGTLEQCEDRAHRIGQKDTVHVHYLVASGTLDDWVWSALAKKTSVVAMALNGKKQVLRMVQGSTQQVDCLSSADAYIAPSESSLIDIANVFQENRMREVGQKTVLEFFSSQKDKNLESGYRRENSSPVSCKKKIRLDETSPKSFSLASSPLTIIDLIQSDNEENIEQQFRSSKIASRSCRKINNNERKTSKKLLKRGDGDVESTCLKWSCDTCTFLNHPLLKFCEMCSTKRKQIRSSKIIVKDVGVGLSETSLPESVSSDVRCEVPMKTNIAHSSFDHDEDRIDVSICGESPNCETETVGYTPTQPKMCESGLLKTLNSSLDSSLNDHELVSDWSYIMETSVVDEAENFDLGSEWDLSCSDQDYHLDGKDTIQSPTCKFDYSGAEEEAKKLNIELHESFQFLCSKHTSRIYLYDKSGKHLNMNFCPVDLQMENYDELPDVLQHPRHLRILKRFVREWNSLSMTKRQIIVKSGQRFVSPTCMYETLKSVGRKLCHQRYSSKADIATASFIKAQEIGGSVRTITKSSGMSDRPVNLFSSTDGVLHLKNDDGTICSVPEVMETLSGFVQAVDANGNPLCLQCQSSFSPVLVDKSMVKENPWLTRLCSKQCTQQFWMRRHRDYGAQQVYDAEHGVCQLCNFDARAFLQRIESTIDLQKRINLIEDSVYKCLSTNVKEKMVRQPSRGMFWNVDHIVAVADGGGQCDIDNLRTLCTVCHRQVTAKQNKSRAQNKLLASASECQSITSFFRPVRT